MSEDMNHHRRRFLGTALTTMAAASLGLTRSAGTQATRPNGRVCPLPKGMVASRIVFDAHPYPPLTATPAIRSASNSRAQSIPRRSQLAPMSFER